MAKINLEKHVYNLMTYQFIKGEFEELENFVFIAG